ncbi:MAG: DUF3987 domain-containing protein [Betaproteobacteria bacterium]
MTAVLAAAPDVAAAVADTTVAAQLLDLLIDDGSVVSFQTFAERAEKRGLARVLHGTLADHATALTKFNRAGAGVFFMVNRGDGNGRSARNVTAVRALFLDLDGAPLTAVPTETLPPHAIIESSPGRFHVYWRVHDCALADFPRLQKALAARFGGDLAVCDLPRVMRLPGFLHQKQTPFVTRIVSVRSGPAYAVDELVQTYALDRDGPADTDRGHASASSTAEGSAAAAIEANRNVTLMRIAGKLRHHDLSPEAIAASLLVTNRERCRPPLDDHEVRSIARSVGRYQADDDAAPVQWPPLLLPGSGPAPELPATLLPGWAGAMADAVARSTQTPAGASVLLTLAVLATVVQRRFEVAPWNDEYQEPLCLWVLVALPSGARKTPVMRPLLAPLFAWEKRERARLHSEIARVAAARGVAKRRIERLEINAAKKDDPNERDQLRSEIQQLIETMPDELWAPRLVTGDTTPERLQGLLVEHRERIALFSDESGIFTVLAGLYSGGQMHLDAFLQAHSGAPIRVDRTGRTAHIDRPALSFGLALQPKVLQEVAKVRRFRDTGFLARFLFALPESTVGRRNVRLREPIPPEVTAAYESALGRLLEGAGDKAAPPRVLPFTAAARECWLDFHEMIEHAMAPGEPLEPVADWAGKLPGHTARIAALLAIIQHGAGVTEIDLDAVRGAVDLCQRLIAHALAAFRLLGADEIEAGALVLLRWIRANHLTEFDRSRAHKALEGTFRSVDLLKAAAARLAEWNVLSRELKRVNHRAPPTPYYTVNPQLFDHSGNSP